MRPRRRQPTRLPCPWDSPGKNTGVGCHFLLQCIKVKSESEVAQSRPTLCDSMDWSFPVFQYLPEFAQTLVHWGSDASQLFHPLLPPSLPSLILSQHQVLFHQVAKMYQVLRFIVIIPILTKTLNCSCYYLYRHTEETSSGVLSSYRDGSRN